MADKESVNLYDIHANVTQKLEERKQRADEQMFALSRRLSENGLTAADLGVGAGGRQTLMEVDDETMAQYLLPEEIAEIKMRRLQQKRQRQRITEEAPDFGGLDFDMHGPEERQILMEDAPARADWVVKQFVGETRGGSQVPVWKVVNPKTGFSHQTLFRIEEVARKIAHLLNESGNPNDPRVVRIVSDYTKRDRLLKEARALEKDVAGKPMKADRLRAIKSEIAVLDYRLGI